MARPARSTPRGDAPRNELVSLAGGFEVLYSMRRYHVYILASERRRLYVGVTGRMLGRLWQHKHHAMPGFTTRYHIDRLVHVEEFADPTAAIAREKQLKSWPRGRKIRLVESTNAGWLDLSIDWLRER